MRRAVLYIRVSTKEQAEHGDSIPAQRDRLHKWAREHGYVVVDEYVDAGESARVTDRPAFLRLMADSKQKDRRFDTIIVWKWDRFARNAVDATMYKAMLRRELGVELIAVGDPQPDGAIGQLVERIIDVVAEFQSLVTGEHVYNTMTFLAKQGKWMAQPPYGYVIGEDGYLKPDPETAPVVQWTFEQFAQGRSASWLVRELAAGKPYPISARRRWVVKTVKSLLSNPAYIGMVRWNVRRFEVLPSLHNGGTSKKRMLVRDPSEWIEVPNAHPPLISMDLWEEVQRRLRETAGKRTPAGPHPFRGLIKCFRCGGNMFYNTKWGGRQPRWECAKYYRVRPDDRCRPMVAISDPLLRQLLWGILNSVAEGQDIDPNDIVFPDDVVEQRKRRLQYLKEQEERLLDAYLNGVLTLEKFAKRKATIDKEIEEIENSPIPQHNMEKVMQYIREAAKAAREVVWRDREKNTEEEIEDANSILRRAIREVVVVREGKKPGQIIIRWWAPIRDDD